MVDQRRGRARRDVEDAPHRRGAIAHSRPLDGGALPERPPRDHARSSSCARTSRSSGEASQILPATTPPSQPYWLREEGTAGLFHVDDPALIGRPENPPAFPIEYVFEVGGQTLVVSGEPVPAADPRSQPCAAGWTSIPPVSLRFVSGVQLFAPGAARPVTVEVTAARARAAGTVRLEAPAGWKVAPASQPFRLAAAGERARFTFTVTAPAQPATATLAASVEINGARFNAAARRDSLRPHSVPAPPAAGAPEGGGTRAGDSRPSGRLPAWRGRRRGRAAWRRWGMRSRR